MIILVTGASASGKSEYAERRIMELNDLSGSDEPAIYIATMQPYGDEGKARVLKHRKQRQNRRFDTAEIYSDLEKAIIAKNRNILLECMSNLVANEMFSEGAPKSTEIIEDKIIAGIKRLALLSENLVIVTNEVFSDTLDYDLETVKYIRLLASVNRKLAFFADEVVEVVYGIPLRIV